MPEKKKAATRTNTCGALININIWAESNWRNDLGWWWEGLSEPYHQLQCRLVRNGCLHSNHKLAVTSMLRWSFQNGNWWLPNYLSSHIRGTQLICNLVTACSNFIIVCSQLRAYVQPNSMHMHSPHIEWSFA
jgi:hypothetical protein